MASLGLRAMLAAVALLPACHGSADDGGLDAGAPDAGVCADVAPRTGPPLRAAPAGLGIDFEHHRTQGFCTMPDIFAGGVCLFDFDRDGDLDAYFTDRAPHPNRLYRNDHGAFVDVTEASGAGSTADSMGCLAFDYDGDGDLDLYLTNNGPDQLLRNDAGVFHDVTAEVGLVEDGMSASATAGDIDGDGDLNLVVAEYVDPTTCGPSCPPEIQMCVGLRSLVFSNDHGRFVEVGKERGITANEPTLAVLLVDFDRDGDLDLYVGNDNGSKFPDRLYVNDGTGHFVDRAPALGLAYDAVGDSGCTMGASVGDYDHDGAFDLVSTNFESQPTLLYSCHPGAQGPHCVDSHTEGVDLDSSIPFTKWGIGFVDFDADGDLDIFSTSGRIKEPAAQRGQLYFQRGRKFVEHVPGAGEALAEEGVGRGVAFGDLDGDGGVDVVVARNLGRPQILLDNALAGHTLTVELDTTAVGALVTVTTKGMSTTLPAIIGGSYLGSSDPRLSFGLGKACTADLTVKWLDGHVRTLRGVAANQVVRVAR